jgi:hypothetical protein
MVKRSVKHVRSKNRPKSCLLHLQWTMKRNMEHALGKPVVVKPSYSVMGVAFTHAGVKAHPTAAN